MRELLTVVVSWTTITALTSLVLRFDERRLTREQRALAFPRSSRLNATFGLALMSPLQIVAIPVHLGRTRRSVLAVLVGVLLAVVVLAIGVASAVAVDEFPELPFPTRPDDQAIAAALVEGALFVAIWVVLARASAPTCAEDA